MLSYLIDGMRVVATGGRVALSNPERLFTVHGKVWRNVKADGSIDPEPLTIRQKNVTVEDVNDPVFAIDVETGTLTLPSGERGRKSAIGIDADAIDALLAAARGETAENAPADADASADAPKAKAKVA